MSFFPRLFLLLVLFSCFGISAGADPSLEKIIEREWRVHLEENPTLAIYLGAPAKEGWGDSSIQARSKADLRYRKALQELRQIDESALNVQQRINKRLFTQQLQWQVDRHRLGLDLFTMNQRDGLHTTATVLDSLSFRRLSDFQSWVERLETFGELTDREIAVLQEAVKRQRVHPKIITERLIELVEKQSELSKHP